MLSYYGITEIVGEPGSGKTAIAIEESKRCKTLYLTSTNFPVERYDFSKCQYEGVFVELIQSTADLLYILNHKIKAFSNGFFELIIIDSLFHIIFIDNRSFREVTNVIYILKRLIQKYKTRVLVLNTCCLKTMGLSQVSFIQKLGLNWEYHVNTKYYCKKIEGGHSLELVKSPVNEELFIYFKIHRNSIEKRDKV